MDLEGRKINAGTNAVIALADKDNSPLVTPAASKHEFSSIQGEIFIGANPGGTPVTTQAGLSVTTPALTLYNPTASGVNLVLLTVTVGINAAPAAASTLMLAYNSITASAPSSTTDATMISSKVGSTAAPNGRCYRVATLAASPTAFRYIGSVLAASSTGVVRIVDNVDGEIVIPPGGCISIQATTAISILTSFTWKEVEI